MKDLEYEKGIPVTIFADMSGEIEYHIQDKIG
jgi:hypothetical protein